jgi:hypothetical protein
MMTDLNFNRSQFTDFLCSKAISPGNVEHQNFEFKLIGLSVDRFECSFE